MLAHAVDLIFGAMQVLALLFLVYGALVYLAYITSAPRRVPMKISWTYSFECDKSVAEMLAALNALGPWKWTAHCDALGLHLCSVSFDGLKIRISTPDRGELGPAYKANLRVEDFCKADLASVDRVFRSSLRRLPVSRLVRADYCNEHRD